MENETYGIPDRIISANLEYAMAKMEEEGELLFPKEGRCLGLGKPSIADDTEQRHLKTWKLGAAILFLMDEKAKYYKPARESWNESCNGHEYNIKVEVARID